MERKFWMSQMPWNPLAVNKTTNELEAVKVMMHCDDQITNSQLEELPKVWKQMTREAWMKALDGKRKMDESSTIEIFYLRKEECREEVD